MATGNSRRWRWQQTKTIREPEWSLAAAAFADRGVLTQTLLIALEAMRGHPPLATS
jgi:hypothetical protein